MVFGPNATINVSGSFHATTADHLKMPDGQKVQGTNPDARTFSDLRPVDSKGGPKPDVGNPGGPAMGGSIFGHAGVLTISASEIGADNYGSGSGRQLVLRGEGQVALNSVQVQASAWAGTST